MKPKTKTELMKQIGDLITEYTESQDLRPKGLTHSARTQKTIKERCQNRLHETSYILGMALAALGYKKSFAEQFINRKIADLCLLKGFRDGQKLEIDAFRGELLDILKKVKDD